MDSLLDGAPIDVGLYLVPFGLYEDGFAVGVAGEGLLRHFVPKAFGLCGGDGVAVLVFTDYTHIAVEYVLACRVAVVGVETVDGRVGKDGLDTVGCRNNDESIASYIECIEGRDAECWVVKLLDEFEVVGFYGCLGSGSYCEVVGSNLFCGLKVDVFGFCTTAHEYGNSQDDG